MFKKRKRVANPLIPLLITLYLSFRYEYKKINSSTVQHEEKGKHIFILFFFQLKTVIKNPNVIKFMK